jgi:hypothetical protein
VIAVPISPCAFRDSASLSKAFVSVGFMLTNCLQMAMAAPYSFAARC